MKNVEQITEGKGYTAINMGPLNHIGEYSIIHPKLNTGTEISFNVLPPHTEVPYFHRHTDNEETYIILKGCGDFQISDDCFPVCEGSVVRVRPIPSRDMRNFSDEAMIYIVVQSKENS